MSCETSKVNLGILEWEKQKRNKSKSSRKVIDKVDKGSHKQFRVEKQFSDNLVTNEMEEFSTLKK